MKRSITFIFSIVLIAVNAIPAQVRPVNDYGALGIGRLLRKLNTTASVMMIGAHPDDEDSSLLAFLARGENARTAYLSLTRGDGGQNIIGPELFESLGVIRTEELLQARRLDGAEQYFARAFDYGFSKSLAEAKQKWDEKIVLCDVVRGIRSFRPMVVLSRFSGTPSDGHGQHQYAGYITPLAVKAAADPAQCSQAGPAWQVLKFYSGIGGTPTLRVNTGQFDTMLGRSYSEIAIEGRSQHRSQGEGRIEVKGERFSGLNLVDSKVTKVEKEKSIFDGIDTTITADSATVPPSLATDLEAIKRSSETALKDFRPVDPRAVSPALISGLKATRDARSKLINSNELISRTLDSILTRKESEFSAAIAAIFGITIDALSDKETIVPGDDLIANVNTYFPKDEKVSFKRIALKIPDGWKAAKNSAPTVAAPGFGGRDAANQAEYSTVTVAENAPVTQPYWLEGSRDGDLFRWPDSDIQNLPFQPQSLSAQAFFEVYGTEIMLEQPVQYRFADPSRGEIRREINVVPRVSVNITPTLLIIPQGSKSQTKQIALRITDNSSKILSGSTDLKLPEGWKVKQGFGIVQTGKKGNVSDFVFDLEIPANTKSGNYPIGASVELGEERFRDSMTVIAYPHIQTHRFYTKAESSVSILDLKVASVKVGYIMGSGDEVPEAIRQMGLAVTMLEEKDVASGDLSKFDTIVVGIRASETRPDLVANNGRLLEYARNGGNLIVQYQRGNWTALAPFPVTIADTQRTAAGSIARVVDENAKVNILEPVNPIFNTPNKITDADFTGWVQERNAYNLVTFDPQYTPLLESHDAGEAENKGGLVMAKLGTGTWTYCSYSFFRQLPNGVGGAYRLFANLLSLPKAQKAKAAK
ncbi:MAG: PIG-L family deacetylase [Pyrinomonadaceae bacterium]